MIIINEDGTFTDTSVEVADCDPLPGQEEIDIEDHCVGGVCRIWE